MKLYQKYIHETIGNDGSLQNIRITWPDNFNFGYDVVDATAAETPEKRAMVWCNPDGEEHIFTFEDVRRESCRAANVLAAAGIGRGDHVMLALKRHYEYWFLTIALHKLGAVLIPVTHMLTTDDYVYRLGCVDVRAIICTPLNGVPARVQEAAARTGSTALLYTIREDVDGFMNFSAQARLASPDFLRRETAAADPMVLYFTSGTTGYPKGVIHDFSYPLAHYVTAKYWQRAEDGGLHFTVSETGWAKASWGKLYGQWLVGCAVMVYDFDNFDPKLMAEVINRYGVTSFCAPPTVFRYFVRRKGARMPSLKHVATAGELMDPEVARQFTALTGLRINPGYGQTETTLLTGALVGTDPADGSMGSPSPLYRTEIRLQDGSIAPVGEIGEVVILPEADGSRPVGLFAAYLDNDELYRTVWRGGVYHTGDAAWRDENGVCWFHGRFDDIIKSGGFRIGPGEIEHILSQHPAVLECSIIGVRDPARGQAIKAVVVPEPGFSPSRELGRELREFCNARLAEYKWIRSVEFTEELPKTISGKVRRAELRRREA